MHLGSDFMGDSCIVRTSKRAKANRSEFVETVQGEAAAWNRVHYWAKYFTDAGFGSRFGFYQEHTGYGYYAIYQVDRSIEPKTLAA
jgi:hypothetical protein